jgi:hypothetical protein
MFHDPHRLREELCDYLTESARSFRDILKSEGEALPAALRGEIEFLENFCRFAVASFARVIGRRLVAGACEDYQRTGDPLYAWSAFRMCREWTLPVPETVLSYLETAAARLLAAEAYGGDAAMQAAAALGLFLDRGRLPGRAGSANNPDGVLGRLARDKLQGLLAASRGGNGGTDPYLGLRRSLYFNVALALDLLPDDDAEAAAAADEAERKERDVIRYIRDQYAELKNGA